MESSGIQVVLPNMIEFIPMLIAFVIVAIVLYKFGWPKFEQMLEARKDKIEGALKESEEKRIEAEQLAQSYKEKLEEAQNQADEILKEAKLKGIEIGKKLEDDAKQQAEVTTQKAKLAIEQDRKAAEQSIKSQSVDVAIASIRKLLTDDLTDDQHRKIIEKYVNESGSLKA